MRGVGAPPAVPSGGHDLLVRRTMLVEGNAGCRVAPPERFRETSPVSTASITDSARVQYCDCVDSRVRMALRAVPMPTVRSVWYATACAHVARDEVPALEPECGGVIERQQVRCAL